MSKSNTKKKSSSGNSSYQPKEKTIYSNPDNYIRVKTDFFFLGHKVLANKEQTTDLIAWKTSTIKADLTDMYDFRKIKKFVNFVNVPDNTNNYKKEISNCYNLYDPPKFLPSQGDYSNTTSFLTHLFGDKTDVILDYLTIIYRNPTQNLPVVCIVSKINETGKTTFLRWLNIMYGNNAIILGNEDFQNKFNSHFATKLIIGIDESFIEKKIIKEKIKRLTTDDKIQLEAKGKDQVKIDFIGKFIMLSNNENNFMEITDEDNRFFIVKAPPIQKKDPDLLEKLTKEIPAFLYFLETREIKYPKTRRLWFDPVLYETDARKVVIDSTRHKVEKLMILYINELFGYLPETSELKLAPIILSEALEHRIRSFNGLEIEIEKVLKENWNLVPEGNQKFNYPTITEVEMSDFETGKPITQYELKYKNRATKPYTITREFIKGLEI